MNSRKRAYEMLKRWLKFNAVGALGICVQLFFVFLFRSAAEMNSLAATALGVEAAVLHNFVWHEHFTWADRRGIGYRHSAFWRRLIAFNGTTGVVSIGGNLLLVWLLVTHTRTPLLVANCTAIAACSVVNFAVNDRLIFRSRNVYMNGAPCSESDRSLCCCGTIRIESRRQNGRGASL